MYGLNLNRLSLKLEEEYVSDISDCSETECDTAESSAERYGEISQDVLQIEDQLESVEEAQEAVGSLEDVASKSEEVINDPNATDEELQTQLEVSQEAFAFAMGKIGYSYKDMKNIKINTESVSNKREKLKLHTESIGTFIKNVIDNIIKFIKKIWDFIVNLFRKLWNWIKGLFIKKPPKANKEFEQKIKESPVNEEIKQKIKNEKPKDAKEVKEIIEEVKESKLEIIENGKVIETKLLTKDNSKLEVIEPEVPSAENFIIKKHECITDFIESVDKKFSHILTAMAGGDKVTKYHILNFREITQYTVDTFLTTTKLNQHAIDTPNVFEMIIRNAQYIINNFDNKDTVVDNIISGRNTMYTLGNNLMAFANNSDRFWNEYFEKPSNLEGQPLIDWQLINLSATSENGEHIGLVIKKDNTAFLGHCFQEVRLKVKENSVSQFANLYQNYLKYEESERKHGLELDLLELLYEELDRTRRLMDISSKINKLPNQAATIKVNKIQPLYDMLDDSMEGREKFGLEMNSLFTVMTGYIQKVFMMDIVKGVGEIFSGANKLYNELHKQYGRS